MGGYEYDVFVSYHRAGTIKPWVQDYFVPVLRDYLTDELPIEPRVFVDVDMTPGVRWPDRLAAALGRSKLLLAVWSPAYFHSPWCRAEWHTMLARERLVRGGPLVHPIRYSDGDSFPPEARDVQQVTSFTEWRTPAPAFLGTPGYVDFMKAVQQTAEILVARLAEVPEWCPDWPLERPDTAPAPSPPLPRL